MRPGAQGNATGRGGRRVLLLLAVAALIALTGLLLVGQLRATDGPGARSAIEREEELAAVIAGLARQSDRLADELVELRVLLHELERAAQDDEGVRLRLERRLQQLRILTGASPAVGPGLRVRVADPRRHVGQSDLVDTVAELRAAGAEALAVNGIRLVARSGFSTREGTILLDSLPLRRPYVVTAIGEPVTLTEALGIPGGVIDRLAVRPGVTVRTRPHTRLRVPARPQAHAPFVYGRAVPFEDANG